MKKANKAGIKAAILTMSFVQMGTNGTAAILADIANKFPSVPATGIQFLMTCPSIFVVIMSLISTGLCRYISRKKIVMTGLSLVCISGLLSAVFHESLMFLYIFAALMGIGIGLVVPVAFAMISDYFKGEERSSLIGLQSSASNMGSMMMTFLGGLLASVSWYLDYLVYFLAIPGLILTFLFIPDNKPERKERTEKRKIPGQVWMFGSFVGIFMLVFYMGPANLAMFVAERQLGDATVAGMAATCLLLGGTLLGLVFGKISGKFGIYTISLGFLVQALGFVMLYCSHTEAVFLIASFVAGMGVSITLPQCMVQLSQNENPQINAFGLAFGLACGNLGTFAAPLLTSAAKAITGQDTVESRFLFCCILAALLGAMLAVICGRFHKS